VRDAIVFTDLGWEAFNVPERISMALASLGCKVLHCEPPVSVFRSKPQVMREVADKIYSLRLRFISSRFNYVPGAPLLQARMMRKQIESAARRLELRDPIFFYMPTDNLFQLYRLMKRDHFIVHTCIDEPSNPDCDRRYVEVSDRTLVIPRSTFHKFRAKFGSKVEMIGQSVDFQALTDVAANSVPESDPLSDIPRPRLAYLGPPNGRLNVPVLSSLLRFHPEWHFISVGPEKAAPISNAHNVPWVRAQARSCYLRNIDVGLLPYRHDGQERYCVPLKLFDCFAFGIPVVASPLIHLWEYKDLIYFGDTAEELARAVEEALDEPCDSPKRTARVEIARRHSVENLALELAHSLPLQGGAVAGSCTTPSGEACIQEASR
jgi:hypothetical protein